MPISAVSARKWFTYFLLTTTPIVAAGVEPNGPGNVASVPYRIVNRHQMVVEVSLNESGPYEFLLDTGTQMTMLEPSLAAELGLKEEGRAKVGSVGIQASATLSKIDKVGVGSHFVTELTVLVYDLNNLQATGLGIRGVLGEDFLERFDFLIDNAQKKLWLDESGTMRGAVKGQHVPLIAQTPTEGGTLANSLIVSARLSDGMRPVRLKLDSGANTCFLYNASEFMALGAYRGVSLQGGGANSTRRVFMALPVQSMKIGGVGVNGVAFVTMVGVEKDAHTADFDGLLSMGVFKRVFVSHAGQFAVLEGW